MTLHRILQRLKPKLRLIANLAMAARHELTGIRYDVQRLRHVLEQMRVRILASADASVATFDNQGRGTFSVKDLNHLGEGVCSSCHCQKWFQQRRGWGRNRIRRKRGQNLMFADLQ